MNISKIYGNRIYDYRIPQGYIYNKIINIEFPIDEDHVILCKAVIYNNKVYITNFKDTSIVLNYTIGDFDYSTKKYTTSASVAYYYPHISSNLFDVLRKEWYINKDYNYTFLMVNYPALESLLSVIPEDWGLISDDTDLPQLFNTFSEWPRFGVFIAAGENASLSGSYNSQYSTNLAGLGLHTCGYIDADGTPTGAGDVYFWMQKDASTDTLKAARLNIENGFSTVTLSNTAACSVVLEYKGTVDQFYEKYVNSTNEFLTYQSDGSTVFLKLPELKKTSISDLVIPDLIIPDAVTDADGYIYSAVILGNQVWMAENLRTTHTANSDIITSGTNEVDGEVPYYYHLNNESDNDTTYGLLYNFSAAMIASPIGWHLPSDEEWTALTDYVKTQGTYVSGDSTENIAKALASTTNWNSSTDPDTVGNTPNQNNTTGFNAIPAGYFNSSFSGAGDYAYFWSSSQFSSNGAWGRRLYYDYAGVYRNGSYKNSGRSVRCICNQSPQEFLFNWLLNHNGYYKISKPNGFEYKLLTTSDVDKIFICNGNGVYEPITISELKAKLDSLS